MDDEIEEELEFRAFMDELGRLQESIFWKAANLDVRKATSMHDDIKKFGDEPSFTTVLFDKIIEESYLDPRVKDAPDPEEDTEPTWLTRFNRDFP